MSSGPDSNAHPQWRTETIQKLCRTDFSCEHVCVVRVDGVHVIDINAPIDSFVSASGHLGRLQALPHTVGPSPRPQSATGTQTEARHIPPF